jgi:periplasmic protein TonB
MVSRSDVPQTVFRVGGAVKPPRVIDAPDPAYSDIARKEKYQGTTILWLIVDKDGVPRNIRVAAPLGMGLDDKAVEAVQRWRFQSATKDGEAVPVQINVEVNFRLY